MSSPILLLDKNLLVHCLLPKLSLSDQSRFLSCDKRLYSMSSHSVQVLRACQRRYARFPTKKWINRCIKYNAPDALQFVLDRTLHEYVTFGNRYKGRDTAVALISFSYRGFKNAFKYGAEWAIHQLLSWYTHLRSLKRDDIDQLFDQGTSRVSLKKVIPDAFVKGMYSGNGLLVRKFLVQDFDGICFLNKLQLGSIGVRFKRLYHQLFLSCLCVGDVSNASFFRDLYLETLEGTLEQSAWEESMLYFLLQHGKSTHYVPILLNQSGNRPVCERMIKNAFRNPNISMLDYVISILSKEELSSLRQVVLKEYYGRRKAYQEILFKLMTNSERRKRLEREAMATQKMLHRLEFHLRHTFGYKKSHFMFPDEKLKRDRFSHKRVKY